jgi:hypothetical protein
VEVPEEYAPRDFGVRRAPSIVATVPVHGLPKQPTANAQRPASPSEASGRADVASKAGLEGIEEAPIADGHGFDLQTSQNPEGTGEPSIEPVAPETVIDMPATLESGGFHTPSTPSSWINSLHTSDYANDWRRPSWDLFGGAYRGSREGGSSIGTEDERFHHGRRPYRGSMYPAVQPNSSVEAVIGPARSIALSSLDGYGSQ